VDACPGHYYEFVQGPGPNRRCKTPGILVLAPLVADPDFVRATAATHVVGEILLQLVLLSSSIEISVAILPLEPRDFQLILLWPGQPG
jgi:hypothetical protein